MKSQSKTIKGFKDMFFRNYIFVFLIVIVQQIFANELVADDKSVKPGLTNLSLGRTGVVVIGGAVAVGALVVAGPVVVAAGSATAAAVFSAKISSAITVIAAKASAIAGATKTALITIGPTLTKVYSGVAVTKVALWLGGKAKEKISPSIEEKLKHLTEEEKEKSFEKQLNEAFEKA